MNLIDTGTTNIKLFKGENKKNFTCENKQKKFGADVITRIEKALDQNKKSDLKDLLRESIDEVKRISDTNDPCLIIGNSVMHHTYYGLSLEGFRKMPFTLSKENSKESDDIFLSPISPFIGSDVYPMALKLLDMPEENILAIDFGTNCEMILKQGERLFAASAPAGPAFDRYCPKNSRTIIDIDIKGSIIPLYNKEKGDTDCILPSAFLKLISFLANIGKIEKNGRLKDVVKLGDFTLDQTMIRELQKAKAAVESLWKMLLKYYSDDKMPKKILVCGNLVRNIDISVLKELNLVPDSEIIVFEDRMEYFLNKIEVYSDQNIYSLMKEKMITIPHYNMPDFEKCYLKSLNFR